jgi:hypothetical protein
MKVGIQSIHLTNGSSNGAWKPKKPPVYRQSYTNADIKKDSLIFYKEKSLTVKQFCSQAKKTAIPYTTFHRHIRLSGLGFLRELNKPVEQAEAIINDYVSDLKKNTSNRTKNARTKNASARLRYLTDNEEPGIVKAKRRRGRKEKEHEKELLSEAIRQRDKRDLDEFTEMSSKIAGAEPYQYSDFKQMLERLRAPFKTAIDGHATTLLESAAFGGSNGKNMVRERPKEGATTSKKCSRTGVNATVNTVAGATDHMALHQSARRDNRLNKEAQKRKLSSLKRENKYIETTLELVEERKKKFDDLAAAAVDQTVTAGIADQNTEQPATEQSCRQEFWEIRENENQENMALFLRLFEPTSGKLSKPKPQQWAFIQSKISPRLTEAAYRAKVEEYGRRLSAIEEEVKQIKDEDILTITI